MIKKLPKKPKGSGQKHCGDKVQYRTPKEALRAQAKIVTSGGDWLNPYECRVCGFWHLGHVGKMKQLGFL